MNESIKKNIAIIGGGASGIFASIRCAEVAKSKNIRASIHVFEASANFLRKVRISGGGRCNVTHHQFEVKKFCENYPRGQKELLSPFQIFQAEDTIEWFKNRGVRLKTESDGRMFPVTNSSETIINCFLRETRKYDIKLKPNKSVSTLKRLENNKISLFINEDESFIADSVLIATGSSPIGYRLAKNLGHTITEIAPSLFTFKVDDPILKGLSGTSFPDAGLTLTIENARPFHQKGPLLITHWGLSGPALLKLSAWAALEMKKAKYRASLKVNWVGLKHQNEVSDFLNGLKKANPRSSIGNTTPQKLSKRFWHRLLEVSHISKDRRWSELSKKELGLITHNLFNYELKIIGKNRFKEEFVSCGGVNLKEINFKTMESKICPGLFFAGEVMDIDGVTGGFNFQNAWTSGWLAGSHMLIDHR